MKRFILIIGILICLTAAHVVLGQQEGVVNYQMKVNLHKTLPSERSEMKEMIPEFNTHRSRLAFRGSESLYSNIEEEEPEFGDEEGPVQVRMRRPMNEYYFNHAENKRVTMQDFFGKNFLIEDTLQVFPWKLASETKLILGYPCKKATLYLEERKQNIVAWYAEKLQPHLGPEIFGGLPGTILEVDINEGERVITAVTISGDKLSMGELKIPSKGEKATEPEFRKMVDERQKRMGGNGNIIIRN